MITGWLHTVPGSTSVYDDNGSVVPLMGVDVAGLEFGTGTPSTSPDSCGEGWSIPTTAFTNVASWGFNSVRIPITWQNMEPTAPTLASNGTWIYHWNTGYFNELDSVVTQFGKAHIAVILDFSQVDLSAAFQQAPEKELGGECEGWGNPTWLYPEITSPSTSAEIASAMCSFFNDESLVGSNAPAPIEAMEAAEQILASRYTSNPTVIGLDTFNEAWFNSSCGSTTHDGNLLTSFYTKMGQAIETVNPHILVVFEEPPPGLMSSSPIMSSPPSVPNAMYEFHIYTSDWTTAQPYVQSYQDKAKSWGVPERMGEFDAFEAGSTNPNATYDHSWQADTQAMLAYCDANGINWAFFSYYSLGTNVQGPVPHSQIVAVLRASLPESTVSNSSSTSSQSTSNSPIANSSTSSSSTASSSTGTATSTMATSSSTSATAPTTTSGTSATSTSASTSTVSTQTSASSTSPTTTITATPVSATSQASVTAASTTSTTITKAASTSSYPLSYLAIVGADVAVLGILGTLLSARARIRRRAVA